MALERELDRVTGASRSEAGPQRHSGAWRYAGPLVKVVAALRPLWRRPPQRARPDEPLGHKDGVPEAARPPELEEARRQIDALDRQIVRLLARRTALARHIGRVKAAFRTPVQDVWREAEVFATRRDWARENRLDGDAVVDVYRAIVAMARRAQES